MEDITLSAYNYKNKTTQLLGNIDQVKMAELNVSSIEELIQHPIFKQQISPILDSGNDVIVDTEGKCRFLFIGARGQ